jgi:MFS family permease
VKMYRIFYGWIIVVLGFFSMAFWMGITSTFSVFYVALLDEFGWQRAASAGVIATTQIVYTLAAPCIGALIHRFGPRRVVVPGIIILGGGLALSSSIGSLAQFYLFYGLPVGIGVSCISMVAFTVIIARWFEARRGLANGLASAGMGVGMFVLVPLSQNLINHIGWRSTYLVLALLVVLILLPANLFLLRHRPQDLGLQPDGKASDPGTGKPGGESAFSVPQTVWTWPRLIRAPIFYIMIIFPALSIFSVMLIIVHNMRFFVDQGIAEMTGAFAFAVVGASSMVFRIIWGWLSDRIGRESAYTAGMVFMSAGIGCLLLLEHTAHPIFIYCFAVCFGIGWGANAPIFAATAADLFRGPTFGLLYGMVESLIGLSGALGAWIGGYIYDITQSYQPAFILAMFTALLSAGLIWVAAPRKVAGQLG